jgi:hypothetical protein
MTVLPGVRAALSQLAVRWLRDPGTARSAASSAFSNNASLAQCYTYCCLCYTLCAMVLASHPW